MNPRAGSGIPIGYDAGSVADWLRRVTVRIDAGPGSHGSGVIVNPRGLILTNAHVARGRVFDVTFADGRQAPGWLLARDPSLDLAALATGAGDLEAATLRGSADMRTGEMVVALGNPADGEGAVSVGILHRRSTDGRFLFADVRLAPGNSGGPLADARGHVIGINSAIIGGLGCAVAGDAIARFLARARLLEAA